MIDRVAKSLSVGVVGGGLGGLAAACVLAARGHRVRLFEKNSWLGGKAAEHDDQGFRFDMGPTILTLPSVLKRIFEEAGSDWKTMSPWCRWIRSGARSLMTAQRWTSWPTLRRCVPT